MGLIKSKLFQDTVNLEDEISGHFSTLQEVLSQQNETITQM